MAILITSILLTLLQYIQAQFLPEPKDVTVIRSKFNKDVSISYKEVHICETTPGVRSWSGYVNLPPGILSDLGVENQTWPINTFFWFFQARKDPLNSPLLIWINGGPGGSSSGNPLGSSGSCRVNPDGNSTFLNEWSWNRNINMLYVDQPVQVGLSYDTLQKVSYNLVNGNVTLLNGTIPEQNTTLAVGLWPSTDTYRTSPGSIQGAYAFWKFAQVFFQDFPEHRPKDTRISLSGVSYGGKYAPAIFAFFEEQNERIRNGTWTVEGQQKELHLDTLILDSGCIDLPVSWFSYPEMAVNNTYGIVGVNDTILANMTDNLHKPGGCLDQAYQCGNLSERYDPLNIGINKTVNDICFRAGKFCDDWVQGPFSISKRSFYDITVPSALSRTPPFSRAYLQRPHVQEALGMRLNWSSGSPWVAEAFRREGDFARPGWIGKLAYLLERGIKVAFVYGDKDYICNWIGGEAVSLAIDYTDTAKFHAAGYANIVTNDSYIGGQVRQHGNLSFSRVFQTGHGIAGQQPETAEKIVYRALFDLDIATGKEPVTAQNGTIYSSVGVSDSRSVRSEVIGVSVLQVCYILDLNSTCTPDQKEAVANGTAIIRNYMVVDKNSTQRYPEIVGDNWGYGA